MTICVLCNKQVRTVDEPMPMKDGYAHPDCYYNALSDVLEAYPIRNPTRGTKGDDGPEEG